MKKSVIGKFAFTIVEILVSLTIIAAVSVLVLPSFQQGLREFAMQIKRRTLFSRVAQAILVNSDKLTDFSSAYDFVENGYRRAVNLRLVCGDNKFPISACEFPKEIFKPDGTTIQMPSRWSELNPKVVHVNYTDEQTGSTYSYSQPDKKAAAFITDNDESILVFFNKKCKSPDDDYVKKDFYAGQYACVNMIYDVNGGQQPPNMIGKDIGFITVFYPTESVVVAPFLEVKEIDPENQVVDNRRYNFAASLGVCKDKRGQWRVPTELELASIFINGPITDIFDEAPVGFWSILAPNSTTAWALNPQSGFIQETEQSEELNPLCIKQ